MPKSLWTRTRNWLLTGLAAASVVAAFVCVVSFLLAETPEEVLSRHGALLPPGWEAGVMNHGHYYRWYALSLHPSWFVAAVLWLAASVAAAAYLRKRMRT